MKVKSFEDLQVWNDARAFVKSIYELTSLDNFKKRLWTQRPNSKSRCFNYE
jgi:hypothetical protein